MIRSMSMVHNPKGCYKKTTKTLFFKHLYLICTLFYNTLSFSYVLHFHLRSILPPPANSITCNFRIFQKTIIVTFFSFSIYKILDFFGCKKKKKIKKRDLFGPSLPLVHCVRIHRLSPANVQPPSSYSQEA